MLQAGVGTPAVVLARPLIFDADEIRRFLDNGSPGLICPFINNGEEAKPPGRSLPLPAGGDSRLGSAPSGHVFSRCRRIL